MSWARLELPMRTGAPFFLLKDGPTGRRQKTVCTPARFLLGERLRIQGGQLTKRAEIFKVIHSAPESGGWLWDMTLSDPAELGKLLDSAGYAELVASL